MIHNGRDLKPRGIALGRGEYLEKQLSLQTTTIKKQLAQSRILSGADCWLAFKVVANETFNDVFLRPAFESYTQVRTTHEFERSNVGLLNRSSKPVLLACHAFEDFGAVLLVDDRSDVLSGLSNPLPGFPNKRLCFPDARVIAAGALCGIFKLMAMIESQDSQLRPIAFASS
jgi:hypothetical protein